MTVDDPQSSTYLEFRDALRADDMLRSRYGEFKKTLQQQFARDRKAYTDGKNDFTRGVLSAS